MNMLRRKLNYGVCVGGHYIALKDRTVEIVLRTLIKDWLVEVKDRA